jgi:chromosome segregation ATPase
MEDIVTTPAAGPTPGQAPDSAYRRARRQVGRWRRRVVDPDNLKERQQKLKARVDQQAKQVAEVKAAVTQLRSSVTALGKRVGVVEFASDHREREHGNLTTQVGHCEQRLGAIEERLTEERFTAEDGEQAEARRLVDEIRREHAQVRVRMQIVGQYEDRLRRLEAEIANLNLAARGRQG